MYRQRQLPDVYEIGSAECWAYGLALRWKLMVEGKSLVDASDELNLAHVNSLAMARMFRRWRGVPPEKRLAICCFHEPGVTNEMVAEWFEQPVKWVKSARKKARLLREQYQASPEEERAGCGLLPNDPTREQIDKAVSGMTGRWANPNRLTEKLYEALQRRAV